MAQGTGVVEPGAPPRVKLTYEQFLQQLDEDTHAEWVDGEIVAMAPISGEHQDVGAFLISLLREFVQQRRLGTVKYEPFQMKTGPQLPGRAPDILFLAGEHRSRLKKTHLEGPADLVVEIISAESRQRDRGEKFREYEAGGVREYWLIDPELRVAEFYVRGDDGSYRKAPVRGGAYHSTVLAGLWIRIEWLWQEPRPTVAQVLEAWKAKARK